MADKEKSFSVIANIKANLQDFKKGMLDMKTLATKGTTEVNTEIEKTNSKFKGFFGREAPDSIGQTYKALERLGTYLKTLASLYMGKKIFDFTLGAGMQFEEYEAGFKAIYNDADRAKSKMKELETFAKKTPYELPEVVQAGITLETAGLDAQRWLTTAGNLSAKNKAKGTSIQYTSQILSNAFSGNYGMAVQQLREQGISESMLMNHGVRFNGRGEVKSDLKTFMSAIEKAVQATAGNQMEEMAKTVPGMLSNIKDSFAGFGRMISDQLYSDFRKSIQSIMTLMDSMGNNGTFKRLAQMASQALKPLVEGFKNFMEWVNQATQNGQMDKIFAGIATAFQAIGIIFSSIITIIKRVVSLFGELASRMGGVTGSARVLSSAIYTLVSAFVAFKTAGAIIGTLKTIVTLFHLMRDGIKGVALAFKMLQSTSLIGILMTIASAILFAVMQLQGVKDFIGNMLDKFGLGSLKELLGLGKGNGLDDMYNDNLDDIKDTSEDIKLPEDEKDDTTWDKYVDTGKDLQNQMRTAIDDIDLAIKERELRNQTNLQNLELKGVYKDSSQYASTEESGLEALRQSYLQGINQMQDVIRKAGNNVADRQTKVEAQNKLLEYQQKANDLLLQIKNNTAEFKNAVAMIDVRNNKFELERQIEQQELEIGGTRPDTYKYYANNREFLKKQMEDYRNAYEKIKSLIPTLDGEQKIQAEIKSLEYLKKSNDLLLEIKKNTDPRNGTFNVPEGIKPWTLLQDRQGKGKSGVVVSGNNFVLNVKEVVDQNSINGIFNDIERLLYERLNSDTRR